MTLVMYCVRVVDSKRMGSEKPNIVTPVKDLGWQALSAHCFEDGNQKKG